MKTEEIKLNLEIYTGNAGEANDEIENRMERSRLNIEKASFYLESLLNLIKYSARHFEDGGSNEDDTPTNTFFADLIHVSEIGRGLTDSIFQNLSIFSDVEHDIRYNKKGASKTKDA